MTATTVSQFAAELKMPVSALLEQLGRAGVAKKDSADALTDQDKARLLDYLRRAHGDDSKTKITLTRKQTSEFKATDSHGRARTVQVEVRKKRVLIKREAGDHGVEPVVEGVAGAVDKPADLPVVEPVVEVVPVVENVPVVEARPESRPQPTVPLASVIGQGELRSREEQDRRYSQLREIQEQELKAKLAREAELARMRQQAEAAAEAARLAGQATQQATAQAKTQEGAPEKGTLHKKPEAPGKDAKKGGNGRADDSRKKPGIKTRSADPGSSWKSGRHGHRKHGHAVDEGQGSFQAPTEIVVREIHVPDTISVSDLAHKMAVKAIEVIKVMMKMGTMVTINQVLDQETAMIVVEEMGHKIGRASCRERVFSSV